jgi:hypothetical protein
MVVRSLALILLLGFVAAARSRAQEPGQGMPNPQAMQMQVQQIMEQRPREAEAAARGFILAMSMQPGQPPADANLAMLDSLKTAAPDLYWSEVAQLTVQFGMVQNLVRRDSARAAFVTQMFSLELHARALQRAYRGAPDAQRALLRTQIEALITKHFDIEEQLRALEIADIERRLADVRAETQRRREKRAEFIKFAVDDIIRDALRPR